MSKPTKKNLAFLMMGLCLTGTLSTRVSAQTSDKTKVAGLYKTECDGGQFDGCVNLANMYIDGVVKDYAKAFSLYQKACDGGEASGCANLGVLYANGRGVAKDQVKAKMFYEKACKMGFRGACDPIMTR